MCFENLSIDDALRKFLDYFTLPGESQKVDRIMQIFAQIYYNSNKNLLKSATSAYTLSYLLIMLQTDLHNPQVKEKMKLSEFIKLAKGINDGEDLPLDYSKDLYERIQKVPLGLHDVVKAKKAKMEALMNNTLNQKKVLFDKESQAMLEKGRAMMQRQGNNEKMYISITTNEYAINLAEILWSPCLAAFSVLLEENLEGKMWEVCAEGLVLGFKLMSFFNKNTESEAFIRSLMKYTTLPSVKEIKGKNIVCMKYLLDFALNYGLYLKESWYYVLHCISSLDHMNVILYDGHDPSLQALLSQIDLSIIDKIFSKSGSLDGESIVYFISSLCKLSE